MSSKKRPNWLGSAVGTLIGLLCALALGAVFYGAMAYQLTGGRQDAAVEAARPEALLTLADAQLLAQQTVQEEMGGEICTVTTRVYRTDAGLEFEAIAASPAAYIERLAKENWTAQLVTGFTLAGMDAVYSVRGEEGMLSCRSGDHVYMLRAPADEQTLYEKGTLAKLQDNKRGYGCEE